VLVVVTLPEFRSKVRVSLFVRSLSPESGATEGSSVRLSLQETGPRSSAASSPSLTWFGRFRAAEHACEADEPVPSASPLRACYEITFPYWLGRDRMSVWILTRC
jgi:hypothetical protein